MLAHETVRGPEPAARRALFLHGLLGSGANLRTIARRFVAARPGWDALTVDLRGHGESPKSTPSPSLAAAARDVSELAASSDVPVPLIAGHSFGGKVALAAAAFRIGHVVTIDSPPGPREPVRGGDSALGVIDMLRAMPPTFASRADFIAAVRARGHGQTLAQWLAMSTAPAPGGGVRAIFDLDELEALVMDYFATDLWPVVERGPSAVHFIIGDRSSSWSPEERARARAAAASPRVTVDVLDTDHWVHAEDPEGLIRVLLARVPG